MANLSMQCRGYAMFLRVGMLGAHAMQRSRLALGRGVKHMQDWSVVEKVHGRRKVLDKYREELVWSQVRFWHC